MQTESERNAFSPAQNLCAQARAPVSTESSNQDVALRWLTAVFLLIVVLSAIFCAGLVLLDSRGRLPPPPLAATDCIDRKLALVRDTRLTDVTTVAIGSSVAWSNFATPTYRRTSGETPYNGGLCYLHVDQMHFWTGLLLERAPATRTIVLFLAPRDFENCDPADTQVFHPMLGRLYLDALVPPWSLYAINFRWDYFTRQAFHPLPPGHVVDGARDWDARFETNPFFFQPRFDQRCFAALRAFGADMTQRRLRLVVATSPLHPEWKRRHDPDGAFVRRWSARVARELDAGTQFIDGAAISWPSDDFADSIHLMHPAAERFTRIVAEQIHQASS